MTRLELPLFPIMLVLSALGHGAALVFWQADPIAPPQLVPPQPGVASVKLLHSEESRQLPTEKKPTDLLADLPILDDLANPPPPTEPTLTKPKEQTMERPRAPAEPTPKLTAERKVVAPAEVPDLRAELVEAPIPFKEIPKKPDPLKPIAMPRPKTVDVELPKMETITKVTELQSKASPASLELDGVVDDLPQKLPINPPPPYPAEAQALRQKGDVWMRVAVSAEGRVTAISIHISSGVQSLDDSALATVRRWIFAPARRGGRAVPYEILYGVEFGKNSFR